MKGTMIHGTRDIRFEDRPEPTIIQPTDAMIWRPPLCFARTAPG